MATRIASGYRLYYIWLQACEAAGMATAAQLSPATWAEAEGFVKARLASSYP